MFKTTAWNGWSMIERSDRHYSLTTQTDDRRAMDMKMTACSPIHVVRAICVLYCYSHVKIIDVPHHICGVDRGSDNLPLDPALLRSP